MQRRRRKGSAPGRRLLLCALMVGFAAVPEAVNAGPLGKEICASKCSSAQSCTFDGVTNVALGDARLSVNDACHLVISNIGSTGQDGVAQVLLPSRTGEIITHFACPNFLESQPGARETMTVYADVPGGIFYRTSVENIGNDTLQINPDFSPVGATRYTITVLDGTTVTGVFKDLPSASFTTPQGDQEEIN
jgi:hypothetical protein